MTTLKFIIGHVRPSIRFPAGFRFVSAAADHPDDQPAPVSDVMDLGLSDRRIGEYAFLFALRRVLEAAPECEPPDARVAIAQYRRFVLNSALGTRAHNVPFARVLSPEEAQALPVQVFEPRERQAWLVSAAARTGSTVTHHYARYHVLRDWLRFLSDAVDHEALTADDARDAALAEIIIPAPSNGVFPASVVIQHLRTLEASALAFLRGGFVERADYQRRALGFCLERLHSHLVQKALRDHGVELSAVQGFHTVITDGPGILATR
jgi:hypothetical protein